MARKRGLRSSAARIKAAGRNGDTELAHLSADEIAILDAWQGFSSINPETGLPEYFSLGKVLKGVAKAAGALVGGALGGPAGAAIGGAATSALLGDSTQKVLTTGLLSGLGAYGAQQLGLGDKFGIDALGSGADLLGRTAAAPSIATAAADKGGGFGMSSLLPMLGLGAAAVGAVGSAKAPKAIKPPKGEPEPEWKEYEAMDREVMAPTADPYSYGQFGPEAQYFDVVNPALVEKRRGGRVGYKYGGNVSEGGKKAGASEAGGQGPSAGGGGEGGGTQVGRGGGGYNVSGGRAVTGRTTDIDNAMGRLGGGGHSGMSATAADRMITDRYINTPAEEISSEEDYWDAVRNLGPAYNDYRNRNQGLMDDPLGALGRMFGGMFGIGEIDPLSQGLGARTKNPNASWGVDPIGGALGLAGMAGVTPFGLSSVWQGIKSLSGYQGPMISFDDYDPISTEESASPYSQFDKGIFSGMDLTGGAGTSGGDRAGGGTGGAGEHARGIPLRTRAPATAQTPATPQTPAANDGTGGAVDPATGRVYHPLTDPYTYGLYGPEHVFFTGDLPMRKGGGVKGPGTGQSDDIPAMLADGEHVIDAELVSMIGDGSNDAGHRRIEEMKRKIRSKKRKAPTSKIPPKTGGLSAYLRSAA